MWPAFRNYVIKLTTGRDHSHAKFIFKIKMLQNAQVPFSFHICDNYQFCFKQNKLFFILNLHAKFRMNRKSRLSLFVFQYKKWEMFICVTCLENDIYSHAQYYKLISCEGNATQLSRMHIACGTKIHTIWLTFRYRKDHRPIFKPCDLPCFFQHLIQALHLTKCHIYRGPQVMTQVESSMLEICQEHWNH